MSSKSFIHYGSKKIDLLWISSTWIAGSVEPYLRERKCRIFEVHLENPVAFVASDPSRSCSAFAAVATSFVVASVVAYVDFAESFVAVVVSEEVSVDFSSLRLHQHLAMQQRQQQVRGGRQGMPGRGGGMPLQMAGLKRPMPGRPMGVLPPKQPRLAPAPSSSSQAAQMNDLLIGTRLCRLCGQAGPYNYLLKDKPEAVEAIGYITVLMNIFKVNW